MPTTYLQDFPDSVLLTWQPGMEKFFEEKKLYLQYPWKIQETYKVGQQIRIHKDTLAEPYTNHPSGRILSMGAFSYVRTPLIAPDFRLGRYCSVASGVELSDMEHPLGRISTHPFTTHPHMRELARKEFGKEVKTRAHQFVLPAPVIGNDVWIGKDVLIKRGVTIGDGAVIGARSVVTKDVPPFAIVAGAPAKLIRFRIEDEDLRERMLSVRWWDYNYAEFPDHDSRDIVGFLDMIESEVEAGRLHRYSPRKIQVAHELQEFLEDFSKNTALTVPATTSAATEGQSGSETSDRTEDMDGASNPDSGRSLTWNQRMKIRNSHGDDTANWWVNDKYKLHEFCKKNGFVMPEVYKFWDTPSELNLDDAPKKFVLKPTVMFSAWGVMLLEKLDDGTYFEELKGRVMTFEKILEEQQYAYDLCKYKRDYRLMMEEKIESGNPEQPVPLDYKVDVYYDKPAQVHQINRNTKVMEFAFFDGNFDPLELDGRIESKWDTKAQGKHERPEQYEEMLRIAAAVTKALGTPYMRVDMFSGPNGPVVGELTPSPGDAYYGNNFKYTDAYETALGQLWDDALERMQAEKE